MSMHHSALAHAGVCAYAAMHVSMRAYLTEVGMSLQVCHHRLFS